MHPILTMALFLAALLPALSFANEQKPDTTTLLAQNPAYGDVKISPDGRYLAHDDKNGDLWLLDLQNGSNRKIYQQGWGHSPACWHPAIIAR